MAISVSVKKFSGREYVYICESFRDPIRNSKEIKFTQTLT